MRLQLIYSDSQGHVVLVGISVMHFLAFNKISRFIKCVFSALFFIMCQMTKLPRDRGSGVLRDVLGTCLVGLNRAK